MIRGGHLDLCVLGALQVAQNGDLANWSTGEPDAIPAVGGAMDLVAGVKSIFVITQHCTREGEAKLVQKCTFPLTGCAVVNRIYTDLAVIEVTPNGFRLVELSPGIDFDFVQERTGAPLLRTNLSQQSRAINEEVNGSRKNRLNQSADMTHANRPLAQRRPLRAGPQSPSRRRQPQRDPAGGSARPTSSAARAAA